MTNEEFQQALLSEIKEIKIAVKEMKSDITGMKSEICTIKNSQKDMYNRLTNIEIGQNEIYQVVSAIEHSNQVGRSELDSQNFRIAKVEGKLKRVAKVCNEEIDVDKVSNL